MARDFLVNELPARLAHGPVTFHLKAQLASPGDSTKDPSQPWPDSDEVVELGMVTIDKPLSDSLDLKEHMGRRQVADIAVDGAEERNDRRLVCCDAIEVMPTSA